MKHIVKLQREGKNTRINIPKLLAKELKLDKVNYLILEQVGKTQILLRRFIDGDDVKAKGSRRKTRTY